MARVDRRSGFTLVEALVAMLLSTLIVGLVTSVFLVQNEFYADAVKKSALQESVRGAVALVSSDLRGVGAGGIVSAESDSVTFRVPLVMGGVCGVSGSQTNLLLPTNGVGVDGAAVDGYAIRAADGSWTYTPAGWTSILHSSGLAPAQACALAGADTTGATADFYRLDGLAASPALQAGDLVMLYQERTLRLSPSGLDTGSVALFTGRAAGTMVEFASGLTPSSTFQYQLDQPKHWRGFIRGMPKNRIAVIRFHALGAVVSSRMGRDSLTFNLTATVPLRNAN